MNDRVYGYACMSAVFLEPTSRGNDRLLFIVLLRSPEGERDPNFDSIDKRSLLPSIRPWPLFIYFLCSHIHTRHTRQINILCIQFLGNLTYLRILLIATEFVCLRFASHHTHIRIHAILKREKNHPFLLLTTAFAHFSNPAHTRNSTTQHN